MATLACVAVGAGCGPAAWFPPHGLSSSTGLGQVLDNTAAPGSFAKGPTSLAKVPVRPLLVSHSHLPVSPPELSLYSVVLDLSVSLKILCGAIRPSD